MTCSVTRPAAARLQISTRGSASRDKKLSLTNMQGWKILMENLILVNYKSLDT